MDCPPVPTLQGYQDEIYERALAQRIPISGTFELTFRCNLDCIHCYASSERVRTCGAKELTYNQVCGIADQLAEEGTLFLLLTGGEPTFRSDFLEIYEYLARKGFLITIFTNGTLITDHVLCTIEKYPPMVVEVTLYGMTRDTYEAITQVPGSFDRCMAGIRLLTELGVPLALKTLVMTPNEHELEQMKTFARDLGVTFRYDALVQPYLNGVRDPCRLRLSPELAVKYDLEDETRRAAWLRLWEGAPPDTRYLFVCGAALSTFNIDPYGRLSPCNLARNPSYDLTRGLFHYGWYDFLYRYVRLRKASPGYRCAKCKLLPICDQCPGWAELEMGDPEKRVPYVCNLAHLRARGLGLDAAKPRMGEGGEPV